MAWSRKALLTPWKSLRARALLLSSISIFRMETSPASAFREPFSVLLCETFLRTACIPFLVVNWFRRSFVDSPASKALRVCCLSSFSFLSEAPLLQRRGGKIKMPFFFLTYKLIKLFFGGHSVSILWVVWFPHILYSVKWGVMVNQIILCLWRVYEFYIKCFIVFFCSRCLFSFISANIESLMCGQCR